MDNNTKQMLKRELKRLISEKEDEIKRLKKKLEKLK